MRNRSFTLVEMLIVVVVIGILATIGFNAYFGSVENSRAQVCATNLKTLKTALDIYVMENDVMPGSLSQIPQETINRAYAKVMTGRQAFLTRLAEAVIKFDERGRAYAAFLKDDLAKGDTKVIRCPSDTNGGTSYSINIALRDLSAGQYKTLPAATPLIMDGDSAEFIAVTQGSQRHGKFGYASGYAQYVTPSGKVEKYGYRYSYPSPDMGAS